MPASVVILQEAVAIRVAALDEPSQCQFQCRQQLRHLFAGKSRLPGVVEETDPQRRCVDGAVVDGWKPGASEVHGGTAQLMQDLPRFLGGLEVYASALSTSERTQGAPRRLKIDWHQHPRCPDAVSSEQCEIPRRAGGEEPIFGCVAGRHP